MNLADKRLVRASMRLLCREPSALGFVAFVVIATVVALAAPLAVAASVVIFLNQSAAWMVVGLVLGAFLANLAATFGGVATVFGVTNQIESGGFDAPLALRRAWKRRRLVVEWAAVGLLLGIAERAASRTLSPGAGGAFAVSGGLAWSAATFLVPPVLAFEAHGPVSALSESALLFKRHIGSVGSAYVRYGAMFVIAGLAAAFILVLGVLNLFSNVWVGAVLVAVGVLMLALVVEIASAIGIYLKTLIYRSITGQSLPAQFVNVRDGN